MGVRVDHPREGVRFRPPPSVPTAWSSSCDHVMERTEDAMSEVKFFDMAYAHAVRNVVDLKPCVELPWNTMLQSDVYVIGPVPLVSR